jgi:hypothetical protein
MSREKPFRLSETLMVILLGETGTRRIIAELQHRGWGRMYVEKNPRPFPGERWGFDNGAFSAWRRNRPFPTVEFRQRLERAMRKGTPYLAVVPDIVGQGQRSLEYSLHWHRQLPPWPWYLAVQDGMTYAEVAAVAGRFAGLFLGGTDRFKFTAVHWCRLAHQCGIKFHYARAGTLRKLEHAYRIDSDSLDSSFPLWNRERFKQFAWRTEGLGLQREMFV